MHSLLSDVAISPDLMVLDHRLGFEKGPNRSKWSTRRLWEFCGRVPLH
jgi:hypothetical protein